MKITINYFVSKIQMYHKAPSDCKTKLKTVSLWLKG